MHLTFQIPENGSAQRQMFDDAREVTNLDHISDSILVLKYDEKAGDEVLHQALRTETYRKPCDAGRGQNGPEIESKLYAYFIPDDHKQDELDHPPYHEAQGFRSLLNAWKAAYGRRRKHDVQPSKSSVEEL